MWLLRHSPRHSIFARRNAARRASTRSHRLEALESRTLLSSLPFDDSGLAPPSLAAQCALPNLPVFNVESYGAVPNSAANQTPSIRAALSAAEAAGGGIVYLPAGTYNVANLTTDASITGSIFTITGSNIVFIGDHNASTGASETFLDGWCMSSSGQMKNPTTFWYDISGGQIGRFSMFGMPDAVSNVQFRSLVVNGQAGWTGNYTVGGVQSSGDGWDLTNKCIMIGNAEVDDVLVFNCSIENWRGEEIYAGGADQTPIDIIKDTLASSDADGVSAGNVFLAYTTIGGTTAGSDLCNGVEDFALSAPEQTTIEDCAIEVSSNPNDLHGNGVAILGQPGTSFTITNSVLDNNYQRSA